MRLKVVEFDRWAEPLGLKTLADKARFCDADPGHFWCVYHGVKGAGGMFVGRVLAAPWPGPKRPEFEDFFEFEGAA